MLDRFGKDGAEWEQIGDVALEAMAHLLFRDVAAAYLAHYEIYSEDHKTMRLRLVVLTRHLGDLPLGAIGPREVEGMIAARLKEGVARSTINRARAALSAVFSWAIDRGEFPGPNPVRKVRKFREGPGRLRYLTPAEADRLMLAAAPHLQGIIAVALHTGGRLREILALTWADVDLEGRSVTFRRETTKSRKTRSVPMSPALHATLLRLRRGRPDQLLFTWNERPLRCIRTAFEAACAKAGLEDVVFHCLRATFSSWYVQNGGNIERLQKYLGHSTIALTQRYAHLSQECLEDGARFIGPPRVRRAEHDRTTT